MELKKYKVCIIYEYDCKAVSEDDALEQADEEIRRDMDEFNTTDMPLEDVFAIDIEEQA